ncbi:MAG TPA: PDZ domain-containing protein [Myxococcota bacterium]|nr:PDZ domain-containing protein [Myxococcota bacterium]
MPTADAPAPLRYRVALDDPASHEIGVELAIPALGGDAVDLVMPVWTPGSYLVRDFARHVFDLEARDPAGRRVPVERVEKHRWRLRAGGRALRVRYRVFAFEESVRTSFFDDGHAFWNGTSVFVYVEGQLDRPCEVEVERPPGWRVSTALPRRGTRWRAGCYDELADSPFEAGTHALHAFRAGGARFELALAGESNADVRRLLRVLRAVARAEGELFGGFPFSRYLFIVHALPRDGGGLEHRASCTLNVSALGFDGEAGYRRFARLAAHELFHAWNGKRIRDRRLGPFDYTRETYTRLLWFHEGFTSFMEGPILLRAGLLEPGAHLADLAERWARYVAKPGRNVTPLSELSFEAWIKQYKPAENFTNRAISYYEKGEWAALVLELLLREATSGRRGVADVFVRLWRRFGARDVGLEPEDVEAAASAVAGRSIDGFFRRYVHGVAELPVPRLLARAGVRVTRRAPWRDEKDATRARRMRGWTGLAFASGERGQPAVVRNVVPDSPAWRAGIGFGDELVAVGGARVDAASAARRLEDTAPGRRVSVVFFRRDRLRETTLVVGRNPERRVRFELDPRPAPRARAIRRGWLGA